MGSFVASPIDANPNAKKIAAWIGRVMVEIGDAGGGLKLRITDKGKGRREQIRAYALTAERPADKLALEIAGDAEEEARDTDPSADHHFTIYAYRGAEGTHFESKSFIVKADPGEEHASDEDIGANAFLHQAHKHIAQKEKTMNDMVRMVLESNSRMMDLQQDSLRQMQARLDQHEGRTLETFALMKALVMDRAKLDYDLESSRFMHKIGEAVAAEALPRVVPRLLEKFLPSEDDAKPAAPPQITAPVVLIEKKKA